MQAQLTQVTQISSSDIKIIGTHLGFFVQKADQSFVCIGKNLKCNWEL